MPKATYKDSTCTTILQADLFVKFIENKGIITPLQLRWRFKIGRRIDFKRDLEYIIDLFEKN